MSKLTEIDLNERVGYDLKSIAKGKLLRKNKFVRNKSVREREDENFTEIKFKCVNIILSLKWNGKTGRNNFFSIKNITAERTKKMIQAQSTYLFSIE